VTLVPSLPVRLAAALVTGLFCLLAVPVPAAAHTTLVSSSPEAGATLPRLPTEVDLVFSEEVQAPAYVVVTAPDGSRVTSGKPRVDAETVRQPLATGPAGDYTVAYRVVSEDGHPVTGELTFTVAGGGSGDGSGSGGTPPPAESSAAPAGSSTGGGDATRPASAAPERGFWERHATHLTVGAALFATAGALLVLSRRSAR
jgi:methionine-rich copper-binding protein CopC